MTTVLTPTVVSDLAKVGPGLWRKQILRLGNLIHPTTKQEVRLDEARFAELMQAFDEHARDQTPFVFVDEKNRHPDTGHPEQFEGELVSLSREGDGLDGVFRLSPKAEAQVKRNPRLGVSARLIEAYERSDGKRWPAVIEHVAATLDPVATGLGPWAAVNLSKTETDGEVIDLSTKEFDMAEEDTEKKTDAVVDEAAATALVDKLSDADLEKIAALLLEQGAANSAADDDTDEDADADADESAELVSPELVSLSNEARTAIDLARSEAKDAQDRTAALEVQLANERADREADAYRAAGVPPAMVNLARPALASTGQTIDLSNGQSTDSGAIIRGLLNEARGTVDLSKEKGHGDITAEDKQRTEALQAAWDNDFPESARIVNKK